MARRAAIYLRESKLEKEDRWGIPVQRQHALDHCKEKGYEVAGEYVDPEGDSYEVYRPALERLRSDMREGKIDVIVVDRFDRMARTEPLMDFIRGEAKVLYDVDLEFTLPSQQFDMSTAQGRLLASVQSFADQQYREAVTRNTQNARKARAKSGKILPARYTTWGWQWADETHSMLQLNPATAPLRKRLCEETLSGRLPAQIARDLTSGGIPMPSGKIGEWHAPTVVRLLKDSINKGEYVIYRWSNQKERRVRKDGTIYHPRVQGLRPVDDSARVVVHVEPLISEQEFDLIQAVIAGRKQGGARHHSNPQATLLYGGMVRCGYCGQVMGAVHRAFDGQPKWFYRCRNQPINGERCGSKNVISAPFLDKQVWAKFASFLSTPDNLKRLYQEYVDQATAGMDRDAEQVTFLDTHLAELDKSIALKIKRLGETENDEVAAGLQFQLDQALAERDAFRQMRVDALEREQHRSRLHDEQEEMLAWMRAAWDTLHEEGDNYELRRNLLLAFDVRVIAWRVGQSPRWVVLRGMEELVQGELSGDFQAHLLYDGDRDLAPAVLGDLAPTLKREIRWRSKRSGQRLGQKSAVECE